MPLLDRLRQRQSAVEREQKSLPRVRDFAAECDKLYLPVMKIKCTQLIERALLFHPHIADKVWNTVVVFDADLRNKAGVYSSKHGISLHPGLKRTSSKHLIETFLHELAHAMQLYRYGEVNHGETWHEMMHQLAQRPVRLHNIETCKETVDFQDVLKLAREKGL